MKLRKRRREVLGKSGVSINPLEGERYLCCMLIFNGGKKVSKLKLG